MAQATNKVPENVALMCALLNTVERSEDVVELTLGENATTAHGISKASEKTGSVVFFEVEQKAKKKAGSLILHFTVKADAPSGITMNLQERWFESSDKQNNWSLSSDSLVLEKNTADLKMFTKNFGNLKAGFVFSDKGSGAIYLNPGEQVMWRLSTTLEPTEMVLKVSNMINVTQFYEIYTECIKSANDYKAAIQLFQQHHISTYTSFLDGHYMVRQQEKPRLSTTQTSNKETLEQLKGANDRLQGQVEIAREIEETKQKQIVREKRLNQKRDATMKLTEELNKKIQEKIEKRRQELIHEHEEQQKEKQTHQVKQLKLDHKSALENLAEVYKRKISAAKDKNTELADETEILRMKLENLDSEHKIRLHNMKVLMAQETENRMKQAREDSAQAVDAYIDKRQGEATLFQNELAAIEKESKLFNTFHLSYTMEENK